MTEKTAVPMTPEAVLERFESRFGDRIISSEVRQWYEGTKKTPVNSVWFKIDASTLHDAIEELISIDYPHLGVISAVDMIEEIDVLYHLTIFFGDKGTEITVNFTVSVPKENPVVPTIADLIPGAVYSEREKQELMGIKVENIPDERGLFLPDDFPEGIYPWRKDEAAVPDSMVKNLWASGRPQDRPNPPVKPKPEKKKKSEDGGAEKTAPKKAPKSEDSSEAPKTPKTPKTADIAETPAEEVKGDE